MRLARIALALACLGLVACSDKFKTHRSGGVKQDASKVEGNRPDSAKKEQFTAAPGPAVKEKPARPVAGFSVDGKQRRNGPQAASMNRRTPASSAHIDPITGQPRKKAPAQTDPYGLPVKKKANGGKNAQRTVPPAEPAPGNPKYPPTPRD